MTPETAIPVMITRVTGTQSNRRCSSRFPWTAEGMKLGWPVESAVVFVNNASSGRANNFLEIASDPRCVKDFIRPRGTQNALLYWPNVLVYLSIFASLHRQPRSSRLTKRWLWDRYCLPGRTGAPTPAQSNSFAGSGRCGSVCWSRQFGQGLASFDGQNRKGTLG